MKHTAPRRAIARHLLRIILGWMIVCSPLVAARATIQEESCIEPDIEYPVPCDDDE